MFILLVNITSKSSILAHEETQSRKRVRVEDIEDEDDPVKIVSIASSASVGLLLVILTSNINILVFFTSIYLQFIYKLIFIRDLFTN